MNLHLQFCLTTISLKKSNVHYTGGITPKRVTSGGGHLRGIASGPAMAEAFLKWGGPKPMTRFSSPTTRAGSGVARNIKRGEHNFHISF